MKVTMEDSAAGRLAVITITDKREEVLVDKILESFMIASQKFRKLDNNLIPADLIGQVGEIRSNIEKDIFKASSKGIVEYTISKDDLILILKVFVKYRPDVCSQEIGILFEFAEVLLMSVRAESFQEKK